MSEATYEWRDHVRTARLELRPQPNSTEGFTIDSRPFDRIASDPEYRHFVSIPGRIVRCLDHFQISFDRSAAAHILLDYYLFIGVVDNAIDSGVTDTPAIVFERLATTGPQDGSARSDIAVVTERLKRHLHETIRPVLIRALHDLNQRVLAEQSSVSIEEYVASRKQVGALTADISYLLVRPLLAGDHEGLRAFMARVGAVGCLIDSLIDLNSDRRQGLLNFRPTALCYFKLMLAALTEGLAIVVRHPRLVGLFWQAIVDNYRDRFGANSNARLPNRKLEAASAD